MSSTPIQLRRGSEIPPGEKHYIGEPIWDPVNSRLGLFNNRNPTAVEWYPVVIGDKMLLNSNQVLGGYNPSGLESYVVFEWGPDRDTLILKNANSSEVYATFSPSGATFNAIAAVGNSYVGIINRLLNGNLAVKKKAFPITTLDTNVDSMRSILIAPNWQMWKQAGSSGRLNVSYYSGGDMPFDGCPAALLISASAAPNSSGIRTFDHGYEEIAGKEVTLSWYVWGPTGQTASCRGISQNGNTLFSSTILTTGSWQLVQEVFTPPADDSLWAGFDLLYNPSGGTPTTQTWRLGPAQLNFGNGIGVFENRPRAMEESLCMSIYKEGKEIITGSTDKKMIGLQGFANGVKVETLDVTGAKQVSVASLDELGFRLSIPTASTESIVKYAAYVMPTTAETE